MSLGIQKKFALTVSFYLLVVFSLSCWWIFSYTSALTRENIHKQQYAMTEIIARSIDDKLGTWLVALAEAGQTVPENIFTSYSRAQAFLDGKGSIRSMFTSGIMLLDKNSRFVAGSPEINVRRGARVVELEAFLKSVEKNGLPDISNPYPNPGSNTPTIVMAVPLTDNSGNLLGFFAGSINLTSDYFIEEIMGYTIGKKGYLYLISKDRTMILHPDKSRIMKRDVLPGMNKLLDKALLGFEGSGETVNSRGVKQLLSFKGLRTVDWILGCVFPRDEAYETIYRLRNYLIIASILVVVLSIVLIWFLTARITRNLKGLTRQVALIREGTTASFKVDTYGTDEVGILAATFNELLARLAVKEDDLVSQRNLLELQTVELQEALDKVKVLGGIIPICAWCKKIRNDSGYWDQLEHYISEHSDADFSHSVCPECFEIQKKEIEEMHKYASPSGKANKGAG